MTTTSSPSSSDAVAEARRRALGWLARREHTRSELARKLGRAGFAEGLAAAVLDALEAEGLLSETRFAEAYAASRAERGYGPLRIRAELRERGVPEDTVSVILADFEALWPERLAAVARKRFGGEPPHDARERAARIRFLQMRGFAPGQIERLLRQPRV